MHAWEYEPLQESSLYVGIPITPSHPYWSTVAIEAFDRAWKPARVIRRFSRSHGVAHAREQLVKEFLSVNFSHFLMLDSDIVIQPDTIKRMIEVNKPVVLARYHETSDRRSPEVFRHSRRPFARDMPIDWKVNEVLEFPQQDGEDVLLAGLGCMLVKREVFDKLEPPYFLFSSEIEDLDDYWKVSEDFWFCLKLQDAGIKITYVPDIVVGHIGEAIVWDESRVQFI